MLKKSKLDLFFKIERSNELNRLNPRGMSLTEVRFLAIYQAKINARKPETRLVTFSLTDFCKIMEIKQLTITHIKNVVDDLLCKPVHLPCRDGKKGFEAVPLFNRCKVVQEDDGEWYVNIECHEYVVPYMFEMKKNYFTYELWNALKLKSVNQIRMYEILKQYEKIGNRVVTIEELKNLLGIGKNQYIEYKILRRDVLIVCQQALAQYTDISYTFEPIRQGRKTHALKFIITKNENFKDDLRLKEFIKPEDLEDIIDTPQESIQTSNSMVDNGIMNLYYDLNKVYSMDELKQLLDVCNGISSKPEVYLKSIYYQIRARKKKISNLFSYTLAVINAELRKTPPENPKKKVSFSYGDDVPSYDLDNYIRQLELIKTKGYCDDIYLPDDNDINTNDNGDDIDTTDINTVGFNLDELLENDLPF